MKILHFFAKAGVLHFINDAIFLTYFNVGYTSTLTLSQIVCPPKQQINSLLEEVGNKRILFIGHLLSFVSDS